MANRIPALTAGIKYALFVKETKNMRILQS